MKPLSLAEICRAVEGKLRSGAAQTQIVGVSTDSRTVSAGQMFIPLRGERFDAHQFLDQVAAGGCSAAIVRKDADIPQATAARFAGGLIEVADTQKALESLGSFQRGRLSAKVIGVTGSNGKTTVKRMIHHILSRRFKGTCSPKSFNNNIGVPLTLLAVEDGDRYVVCEMGSNAPGEIAALSKIARPDVAVITSVGNTHLEKLGSIAGVAREKAAILDDTAAGGPAIIWGDSPELADAIRGRSNRFIRFGQVPGNDLRLTKFDSDGLSSRFEVNGGVQVNLPLGGRHMALNAMSAMAAASEMGVSLQDSSAALADFAGVDGRLQSIDCGSVTVIHDAYNANPSSVLAAADVLSACRARRRVMVVGDMRELGGNAADLHRQTGMDIASRKIDLLVGVGELGRYIAVGAQPANVASRQCQTVEAACVELPAMLREGDLVLIKGSRLMAMERLIDPIRRAFGGPNVAKGAN